MPMEGIFRMFIQISEQFILMIKFTNYKKNTMAKKLNRVLWRLGITSPIDPICEGCYNCVKRTPYSFDYTFFLT